jgi:hypothetical protein
MAQPGVPLRIGFFGELGGNLGVINAVVDVLEQANAEFHFFSHTTGGERKALARRARVIDQGATDPRGLHEYFRKNVDLMLIPQGFEAADLQLRQTCFPSKLPEACQIGLPLLIVAPPEGSAARWASVNLNPEVVVQTMKTDELILALTRFRDGMFWKRQQEQVVAVARGAFHPEKLQQQFENILARAEVGSH